MRFEADGQLVADLYIPADVLAPGAIKTLDYNPFWLWERKYGARPELPWHKQATQTVARLRRRHQKAKAARRKRQAERANKA